MILADKIILQRKKNGWTQEELAELMGVTRQSVSKWESAQAIPDIKKVIALSELFGVSTDYLFKDEIDEPDFVEPKENLPQVTLAQAHEFLQIKETTGRMIAVAVSFIIIAVAGWLGLTGISEVRQVSSGGLTSLSGLALLLVLITLAVAVLLYSGFKTEPFKFLNDQPFETEYGVTGMVSQRQKAYRPRYVTYNIVATCLCMLGMVPLLIGGMTANESYQIGGLVMLLVIEAIGVGLFILNGIRWESMLKLLQEGDYAREIKEKSAFVDSIATIYWLTATALYVGYSLITGNWQFSWVLWPIAGLLYAVLVALLKLRETSR